jgi:hypothetical protein
MEPIEPAADAEAPEPAEGQGRGVFDPRAGTLATAKPRKRRPVPAAVKASKRGLHLSDAVWERLQLEAIRKKTTASAVAEDVLSQGLPRLWIGGREG